MFLRKSGEWRRSELELKSDAYGYYLYLDMQAGKITPEEFQQKIERANQDFGLDLVHIRYGADYARQYPPKSKEAPQTPPR